MSDNHIRPRQLAALMIEDFLDGSQLQIDPKDYPEAIQGTAIAHARNAAALVIFWVRRYRERKVRMDEIPKHLQPMVRRYNASRRKAA